MVRTPWWVWLPLLGGLVLVGYLDHATGWPVRLTFFYGLLIVAITVLKGKWAGFVASLASTVWYAVDRLVLMGRPVHPTVWNTFNELGMLLLAWLPLFLVIQIFGLSQNSGNDKKPFR